MTGSKRLRLPILVLLSHLPLGRDLAFVSVEQVTFGSLAFWGDHAHDPTCLKLLGGNITRRSTFGSPGMLDS